MASLHRVRRLISRGLRTTSALLELADGLIAPPEPPRTPLGRSEPPQPSPARAPHPPMEETRPAVTDPGPATHSSPAGAKAVQGGSAHTVVREGSRGSRSTPRPPARDRAPSAGEGQGGEQSEADAKAAAHLEKTRRAVLQFVADAGGTSSLRDMHEYSERRYFVAHQRFSQLMEGIVAESLVDWDEGAQTATITSKGRSYLATTPL